jgi:DNA-binding response OmpR family regulator
MNIRIPSPKGVGIPEDRPAPPMPPAESRPPTAIAPPVSCPLAGLDQTDRPRSPHLLVVEDDEDVARCLRLGLDRKGFAVDVALTASAAYECLQRQLPDVILLDVDLPDLSGLQLCRQLKAKPRTEHIPIVFCSGNAGARARALLVGAADFFEKPPDLTQLAQRLHALLANLPAAKTTQNNNS